MNLTRNKPLRQKTTSPKIVGNARDIFGTRLCHRVVCDRCQKIDYVSVRINDKKSQFCRDCAEVYLLAYEQGRNVYEKKVSRACEQCNRAFMIGEAIALKKLNLLCNDCLRGFDVWRGKITNDSLAEKQRRYVLTKASAKIAFRKSIHDDI